MDTTPSLKKTSIAGSIIEITKGDAGVTITSDPQVTDPGQSVAIRAVVVAPANPLQWRGGLIYAVDGVLA